eukprot:28857-Eustigmatos_ZCMA.PRE.1
MPGFAPVSLCMRLYASPTPDACLQSATGSDTLQHPRVCGGAGSDISSPPARSPSRHTWRRRADVGPAAE